MRWPSTAGRAQPDHRLQAGHERLPRTAIAPTRPGDADERSASGAGFDSLPQRGVDAADGSATVATTSPSAGVSGTTPPCRVSCLP
jgi:hypothetical protein